MEPRLFQHQSQKLVLSPQIRQYLKLLQLPLQELEQAVDAELTENPLLEEKPQEIPTSAIEAETPEAESTFEPPTRVEEVRPGDSYDSWNAMDENFQRGSEYHDLAKRDIKDLEERKNFQDGLLTRPEALSEFLLTQCRFLDLSEAQKKIAHEIIGNIDEDGYLRSSDEELAAATDQTLEEIQKVILIVQDFDPPGVGARTLQETLLIQLRKKHKELKNLTPSISCTTRIEELDLAIKIVLHHLPLLEKRDWAGLSRILSTDQEKIKRAVMVIARLEPKPGRTFYSGDSITVAPEASISFSEEDPSGFQIEIHDEKIPQIRINPYYRQLIRGKNMDAKSIAFLKEKMAAALNFMKAIHLRKSTLREITEQIVKAQSDFLEKGFLHLKPLRLKDIAEAMRVHESTISRAIQGKYVSTPQGMIPYKSFFSNALETTDGTAESQKSITEKIRQAIENEPPLHPLSDEALTQLLKKDGIVIARRTVAKYRELLKILPSHMRKRK